MSPHQAIVDFFVAPQASMVADQPAWLLSRGEPDHCLEVHRTQAEAIEGARRMAAYGLLRGQQARIKVWQSMREGWLVVWCSWESEG